MSGKIHCKNKATGDVYEVQVFDKKGQGIEDGTYKNRSEHFIKDDGLKIHIPVGCFIVHTTPKTILTLEQFSANWSLHKNEKKNPNTSQKPEPKNKTKKSKDK